MRGMRTSLLVGVVGVVWVAGLTSCTCMKDCCRDMEKGVVLFNGKNLDGWKAVSADPAVATRAVWSVEDGVLSCRGTPVGFLYTDRQFTDFKLEVEYRWKPGSTPGNSGIFSRINGPLRPLPSCVEVQLQHGNAGDVLTLQGMGMSTNQARFFHVAKHALAGDIDGVKKLVDAERPAGEWNQVEIVAEGSRYSVWINGQKVNVVEGLPVIPGPVGLQSEGGEIDFRKVTLKPLR